MEKKIQPERVRDQKQDRLLTPQNCVLALIDFQPEQYGTVTSTTRERINLNVGALCRIALKYDIPVILSTVGVDLGSTSERSRRSGTSCPESRKSTALA